MEMPDDPQMDLPRRLNGRPAACDQCRARKLGCDHTRPVCSRCRRRPGSVCVYSGPEPRRRRGGASVSRPSQRASSNVTPPPRAEQQHNESDDRESLRSGSWPRGSPSHTPPRVRGYLGPTSYTAVFEEATNSLPLLGGVQISVGPSQVADHNDSTRGDRFSARDIPTPLQEMCLYVLRHLQEQLDGRRQEQTCDDDNNNNNNKSSSNNSTPASGSGGWTDIAVERIISSLQGMFNQLSDNESERLDHIAAKLCANTTKPLRDDVATLEEWLGQFCGSNLRWESIGLLWSALQGISNFLHSLCNRRFNWLACRYSPKMTRTCLDYCLSVSRHFAEPNVLLVEICRRQATLESIVYGETALSSFVSFGIATTMLVFLGLHVQQQPTNSSYTPTLCSEDRRRLFAQMFISDKLGVSFTGRPPRLSRRFCSAPLPLDLRDEDLASDPETILRASKALDEQGWNTVGGLYPITVIRARTMIAYIHDELVEIALGHNVDVTLEQLRKIRARQYDTYSKFPPSLMYDPEQVATSSPVIQDMPKIYAKLLVELEHLKNVFFAERLLILHGQTNKADLIATSYTMLSRVLLVWTRREHFAHPHMHRNFEWFVLKYGGPAAGVLCLELLQPTFPVFEAQETAVTRSSIIQQLSLLVGLLDWVRPSAPNAELCADCKTVVQRVLDHHLNGGGADVEDFTAEPMNWGVMPGWDFDLINTFDWMRTGAT